MQRCPRKLPSCCCRGKPTYKHIRQAVLHLRTHTLHCIHKIYYRRQSQLLQLLASGMPLLLHLLHLACMLLVVTRSKGS